MAPERPSERGGDGERGHPGPRPFCRDLDDWPARPETDPRGAGEAAGGHAGLPPPARAGRTLLPGDRPAPVAGRADGEGPDLERPAASAKPAGRGASAMTDPVPPRPAGPHPTAEQLYRA